MINLSDIIFITKTLEMSPPKYPAGALDLKLQQIFGGYPLDIIAIDEHCHEKWGYTEEEHGSLSSFLKLKFPEVEALIQRSFK